MTLPPPLHPAHRHPDTLELMLNPDGTLWQDHRLHGLRPLDANLPATDAQAFIRRIAGLQGLTVTREDPILETESPDDGSRFTAVLPPVTEGPSFCLRKRAAAVFPLSDYVADNILTAAEADFLARALASGYLRSTSPAAPPESATPANPSSTDPSTPALRQPTAPPLTPAPTSTNRAPPPAPPQAPSPRPSNILISGGPGSGKTTLANALIREISHPHRPVERLLLLEDTYELQCHAPCHVKLHTTDTVDLRRLVRLAMRYRPDRILVGEVRGAEALELLKAWNTGTPGGVATVHANSAIDALERLDQLVQEATGVPQRALIAASVDVVAHLERRPGGRKLTHLVHVLGLDERQRFVTRPHDHALHATHASQETPA